MAVWAYSVHRPMREDVGLLPVALSMFMIRVGTSAHPTVTGIGKFIQEPSPVAASSYRNRHRQQQDHTKPDTNRIL